MALEHPDEHLSPRRAICFIAEQLGARRESLWVWRGRRGPRLHDVEPVPARRRGA